MLTRAVWNRRDLEVASAAFSFSYSPQKMFGCCFSYFSNSKATSSKRSTLASEDEQDEQDCTMTHSVKQKNESSIYFNISLKQMQITVMIISLSVFLMLFPCILSFSF